MAHRSDRRRSLVGSFSEVRIYFEGDKALKPGFSKFFGDLRHLAHAARRRFELIPCGSREQAERNFGKAFRSNPDAWNILLIDSEGPVVRTESDSEFWMVQTMEAWFHADKEALESYYGRGFRKTALTANPNVEEIPKEDLASGLSRATKDTKKGEYHKTAHAPELLRLIDPARVRKAAPNCERLFSGIEQKLV